MNYPVSACVFIRDCFVGAFCLFESMASLMPLVDEFVVMDLGSTDGTLETLDDIARHNGKIKLLVRQGGFPKIDAGVFADLANELVALCKYDRVLYYQADEIWHERLLRRTADYFERGRFDLRFWRIQYRDNWQRVKWFPHFVHRVGMKGSFNFVGDGMNTDRAFDAELCSEFDATFFHKWYQLGHEGVKPYVHDMITDVSLVGGFRDNVVERRALHYPLWHETADVEGKSPEIWQAEAEANPDWVKKTSPYNLPAILRWHVGRVKYELRDDLKTAIEKNETLDYIKSL